MVPDPTTPGSDVPRAWQPPPTPARPPRVSRPPTAWGDPVRAMIAPTACGGFLLFTEFTLAGRRRTGVDLGTRWDAYTTPLPAEIALADAGLTVLGLTRGSAWEPGSVPGSLTASVTRTPQTGWVRRALARLLTVRPSGQRNPLAGPGTTGGTEDRP